MLAIWFGKENPRRISEKRYRRIARRHLNPKKPNENNLYLYNTGLARCFFLLQKKTWPGALAAPGIFTKPFLLYEASSILVKINSAKKLFASYKGKGPDASIAREREVIFLILCT
jgi:hypothetical protein